ncbi:MAG: RidA family protein [SAR324 cluster bacterium]|uniref:Deaminase n=1 Tax=marine metagenome TaxID=408172 RepID=A0A381Q3L3_9ZZZZ|nr:RidA family protein [SAR324 cluster bacterium]HBR60495.1 deaminase [Deltaproteobacteria bacterium]MDP7171042.1 RidA family protein [SAR324 cluster bacterium]MDP7437877.1 RidA family protein [SAR324 cluster bacterium]MDP7605227.1 RidA family protein [SAR324 cluster bacterium]|tara:strand:- start:2589 stop:2981 length:393 start_codon:yes stop_codon:yes gene_type:complete
MSRSIVNTSKAPAPVGPYSQAVRCGNMLFVSGQVPLDPESGELVLNSFAEQCHRVLLNLKIILEAGGSALGNVLKVTIYMQNIAQFNELNEIYSEYFDASKPARACVEVSALPKGVAVEMDAIAEISSGD